MKRNITIEQPTPHVVMVRTIEGRRREARYAKVDFAMQIDVSFDLKDLRALPGVPQDQDALALWLEDQREDLLEALNDEALKLLREFAEEDMAEATEPRISTLLAMDCHGRWWVVTMHDGEPHSAKHPGSGAELKPAYRDSFVRWGSADPMAVLDAITAMWRPTDG